MIEFEDKLFTENQKKIANYIASNLELMPFMVEKDIAKACSVGISTVSRFWKTINFRSFKEFKQSLMQDSAFSPAEKAKTAFDNMDSVDLMTTGKKYLEETEEKLTGEELKRAVAAINKCKTLYVHASGAAFCLAELMAFRLRRFGIETKILARSGHELFEDLMHIEKEDVIFIFGFVLEAPEISVLFDYAKNVAGCKTILMSDTLVNSMTAKADYKLYAFRGELWEFHSMIAPLALIENMIVYIGKSREEEALRSLKKLQQLRSKYEKQLPKKAK